MLDGGARIVAGGNRFLPRPVQGNLFIDRRAGPANFIIGPAASLRPGRAEGRPTEVTFALTNRGAGHRIPTGDYGHRELRVAIELLDRGGRTLGQAEQAVFPGQDLSLAPGVPTP